MMTLPPDALQRIRECVSLCIGHDLEKVHAESYLMGDLGCDSLDMVEITMEVEEAFQVEIPDDVAEKVVTVGDILRAIEKGQPRGHARAESAKAAKPGAAHTPGPWAVDRPLKGKYRGDFAIVPKHPETGRVVGPAFAYLAKGRDDIQEANARLIAAAPDLLAQVERAARNYWKLATEDFGRDPVAAESWMREYRRAAEPLGEEWRNGPPSNQRRVA